MESKTGIAFPDNFPNGAPLSALGVRYKGPIKVYAVGQYGSDDFILKMYYSVGAQKMTSALVDALKPRCEDVSAIESFGKLLLEGLPSGAASGTELTFGSASGKLTMTVDGKTVGTIVSNDLATSFGNIYTDDNAVCTMTPVTSEKRQTGNIPATTTPKESKPTFLTPKRGLVFGVAIGYGLGRIF